MRVNNSILRAQPSITPFPPSLNNLTMPDEADRFYQDPISFIKQNITDDFPSHIVIYDVLYSSLTDRLKNLGFVKVHNCKRSK